MLSDALGEQLLTVWGISASKAQKKHSKLQKDSDVLCVPEV